MGEVSWGGARGGELYYQKSRPDYSPLVRSDRIDSIDDFNPGILFLTTSQTIS
jgi:hypothetical protein